jgi:hypothetical protein
MTTWRRSGCLRLSTTKEATVTKPSTIEIARAICALCEADHPDDDIIPELRRRFPTASDEDLWRALQIFGDQVDLWFEGTQEDSLELARDLHRFILDAMRGEDVAPRMAEMRAALVRAMQRAKNIFPAAPDKTRS